jgi:DNA-binding transcriptional regulator YiaG
MKLHGLSFRHPGAKPPFAEVYLTEPKALVTHETAGCGAPLAGLSPNRPVADTLRTLGTEGVVAKTLLKREKRGTASRSSRVKLLARNRMGGDELTRLRNVTGLSQSRLGRLIGASWVTISRWERAGVPSGEAEERLHRLERLVQELGGAIPSDKVAGFLETPHPMLRGYRPADLLTSDYAFHDLLALVNAAKSGDMA